MLEKIILNEEQVSNISEIFNNNYEYLGVLLGEITEDGIVVSDSSFYPGGKFNAGDVSEKDKKEYLEKKNEYAQKAKEFPDEFCLIDLHTHGRKFGEKIKDYDPYWTINSKLYDRKFAKGSIVDNKFYVSKKHKGLGDDVGFKEIKDINSKHNIKFFHLFIHPEHGSEGSLMTEDKIQITAYKFNESNIGYVEEIPIEINDKNKLKNQNYFFETIQNLNKQFGPEAIKYFGRFINDSITEETIQVFKDYKRVL